MGLNRKAGFCMCADKVIHIVFAIGSMNEYQKD